MIVHWNEDNDKALHMPHADRWRTLTSMKKTGLRYRLDLGSVMKFGEALQEGLANKCREVLEEIDRICKHEWEWFSGEESIRGEVGVVSSLDHQPPIYGVVDQRKFLYINFASRDDAMLVRISVMDLEKVRNADGGGVSREAE